MNKNTVIALLVGVLAGLIIGYSVGSSMGGGSSRPPVVAAPAGAPAPAGMPGAPGGVNAQQRIAMLQQAVAQDPKNVQAWSQLGNDYFDTNQPQKAVEAYAHVLEAQPNNSDVLTDQGVMYRALGQFDKAVENFKKANEANPRHLQSLFNLGVVYAYDLKQPKKAIEAWEKVVATDPSSGQAIQARTQLEQLKSAK
ncbi:tetratricopeptide repeat protein [Anaeromyxobacter terrae]|uniref:tetratricopeptide repeat protein n=1 Tax=Anaeromyxobacter terrae TaxID=2925406 RepID=UPI001F5A2796|nr:tetratricopeptide repeat protein [Anaeromyxobacter sp. SG22]